MVDAVVAADVAVAEHNCRMSAFIHGFICFIPLIIMVGIVLFADRQIRFTQIVTAVVTGFGVFLPITVFQTLFTNFPFFAKKPENIFSLFFLSLFTNGLLEEGIKDFFLFFLRPAKLSQKTFFLLSVVCGITTGCAEALIYLKYGFLQIPVRFIAIILHGFCAGLSSFTFKTAGNGKKTLLPLFLSVLIHGLYDFFCSLGGFYIIFVVLCVVFLCFQCASYSAKYFDKAQSFDVG